MSPIGHELGQPGINAAFLVAVGTVARLIPAWQDSFRGVTGQGPRPLVQVRMDRAAGLLSARDGGLPGESGSGTVHS
jgi:hypothetical protein